MTSIDQAESHNSCNFRCPSITLSPAECETLGIRICAPWGQIQTKDYEIQIGAVIVLGHHIDAVPHEGISDRQRQLLIGAAELAFHEPPSKAAGWSYRDGEWFCWITVIDEDAAIAAAEAAIAEQIVEVA